jgi:hypothetical protein
VDTLTVGRWYAVALRAAVADAASDVSKDWKR